MGSLTDAKTREQLAACKFWIEATAGFDWNRYAERNKPAPGFSFSSRTRETRQPIDDELLAAAETIAAAAMMRNIEAVNFCRFVALDGMRVSEEFAQDLLVTVTIVRIKIESEIIKAARGRDVVTDDVAEFADKRRRKSPPIAWLDIYAQFAAANDGDPRLAKFADPQAGATWISNAHKRWLGRRAQ